DRAERAEGRGPGPRVLREAVRRPPPQGRPEGEGDPEGRPRPAGVTLAPDPVRTPRPTNGETACHHTCSRRPAPEISPRSPGFRSPRAAGRPPGSAPSSG